MSQRRKPTRAAERTALEEAWRKHREFGPLPSAWNAVDDLVDQMREDGQSEVVIELARIFMLSRSEKIAAAWVELISLGLAGRDWKSKLKAEVNSRPHAVDDMVLAEAMLHIALGSSARQAAERTAAKFGGSASFDAASKAVRRLIGTKGMARLSQHRQIKSD